MFAAGITDEEEEEEEEEEFDGRITPELTASADGCLSSAKTNRRWKSFHWRGTGWVSSWLFHVSKFLELRPQFLSRSGA
jgi:hypothetical protein